MNNNFSAIEVDHRTIGPMPIVVERKAEELPEVVLRIPGGKLLAYGQVIGIDLPTLRQLVAWVEELEESEEEA